MTALPATREAIARLIPHQGAMCLLERVETCNAASIACLSGTHRDAANPLRRGGVLPAAAGIGYALQAMALHGALTAGAAQGPGFLAALSGVRLAQARLDGITGPLRVSAEALAQESRGFIYAFEVVGEGHVLIAGRATILLA